VAARADVDVIVHVAAIADEDTFDRLLNANIVATYHVFEAARRRRSVASWSQAPIRDPRGRASARMWLSPGDCSGGSRVRDSDPFRPCPVERASGGR
jgi:nucleoside-diphosphate-sugar epimerase